MVVSPYCWHLLIWVFVFTVSRTDNCQSWPPGPDSAVFLFCCESYKIYHWCNWQAPLLTLIACIITSRLLLVLSLRPSQWKSLEVSQKRALTFGLELPSYAANMTTLVEPQDAPFSRRCEGCIIMRHIERMHRSPSDDSLTSSTWGYSALRTRYTNRWCQPASTLNTTPFFFRDRYSRYPGKGFRAHRVDPYWCAKCT